MTVKEMFESFDDILGKKDIEEKELSEDEMTSTELDTEE